MVSGLIGHVKRGIRGENAGNGGSIVNELKELNGTMKEINDGFKAARKTRGKK